MKKIIVTLVLLGLVVGGTYYIMNMNNEKNNMNIHEIGAAKEFTQITPGDEMECDGKTFVVDGLEKVSDTKYRIVLSKGNYKDISLFDIWGGKNYTLDTNTPWEIIMEKDKGGNITTDVYISLEGDDRDISELEQIYFLSTQRTEAKNNYTLTLK